ncbi:unnamed protein product [Closterium sp. Yama58-4]|nr:unnamed protein product [Closterium sp. Yama58-4]
MASSILHYSRPSILRPQQHTNSCATRLDTNLPRINVAPLRTPFKVQASSSGYSSSFSSNGIASRQDRSNYSDDLISAQPSTFFEDLQSHIQSAASRILLPSLLAASLLTTEAMLPPQQSMLPPQQSILPPQQSAELAPLSGAAAEQTGGSTGTLGSAADVAGAAEKHVLNKTNVQSGLSAEGKKQAVEAARKLRKMDACGGGCWIWPSISQRAYQTAEIVAYVNGADYSRIVPEYSFLDARGLGAFEGQPLESMREGDSVLSCLDPPSLISLTTPHGPHASAIPPLPHLQIYLEDSVSSRWRPPPFTDGTPHESVADVLVRVTQLMSILFVPGSLFVLVLSSPGVSRRLRVLPLAPPAIY